MHLLIVRSIHRSALSFWNVLSAQTVQLIFTYFSVWTQFARSCTQSIEYTCTHLKFKQYFCIVDTTHGKWLCFHWVMFCKTKFFALAFQEARRCFFFLIWAVLFPFPTPTLAVIIANKDNVGVRYPLYVGVAKYEEFLGGDSLWFHRRTADLSLQNDRFTMTRFVLIQGLLDTAANRLCWLFTQVELSSPAEQLPQWAS